MLLTTNYNDETNKTVSNTDNKLETLGFTYDDKTETYTKVDDDGGVIEFVRSTNLLRKTSIINNMKNSLQYTPKRNLILYKIIDNNGRLKLTLKYYPSTKISKCLIGNCENYKNEIAHILSVYTDIKSIL